MVEPTNLNENLAIVEPFKTTHQHDPPRVIFSNLRFFRNLVGSLPNPIWPRSGFYRILFGSLQNAIWTNLGKIRFCTPPCWDPSNPYLGHSGFYRTMLGSLQKPIWTDRSQILFYPPPCWDPSKPYLDALGQIASCSGRFRNLSGPIWAKYLFIPSLLGLQQKVLRTKKKSRLPAPSDINRFAIAIGPIWILPHPVRFFSEVYFGLSGLLGSV